MSLSPPPLLVVGAGPVGLAIAKALGEVGLDDEQLEASDHVGGNWAHGVYSTAHIISSKKTKEYDDFPMPAHYPDFPSASHMRAYFASYADAFHLRDRIRFESEVTAVVPVGPNAVDGWDVTVRRPSGTRTQRYRGVLVRDGHHWARSLPAWAGPSAHTPGTKIIHSKDFHNPDELRGKRLTPPSPPADVHSEPTPRQASPLASDEPAPGR